MGNQKQLLERIVQDSQKFAANKGNKLAYFKEYFKSKACKKNKNVTLIPDKIKNDTYGNKSFDCVLQDSSSGHIHAIEYKTMGSSLGKNFNNRKEEMQGQAMHAKFLDVDNFSYIWIFDLTNEPEEAAMKNIGQIYNVAAKLKESELLKNNIMLVHDSGKLTFYGEDTFDNFKLW